MGVLTPEVPALRLRPPSTCAAAERMPDLFDLYASHPRLDFWLIPEAWARYDHSRRLTWTRLEFLATSPLRQVPAAPGVYAFVLEHRVAMDLKAAFPMYVGMSTTSIRDRYGAYKGQAYRGRKGRARLDRLFGTWKSHLAFYYVAQPVETPEVLEKALINGLMPPFNHDDFEADIGRLVSAF